MIITLQQLKNVQACMDAQKLFRSQCGGSIEFDYTVDKQEWLLRSEWRRYLGWSWRNNLLPLWSFQKAYLSGADLSRADLREANLGGANLGGADLSRADLRGADLLY